MHRRQDKHKRQADTAIHINEIRVERASSSVAHTVVDKFSAITDANVCPSLVKVTLTSVGRTSYVTPKYALRREKKPR